MSLCPVCTASMQSYLRTDEAEYRRCPSCDYLKPTADDVEGLRLNIGIYEAKFDRKLDTAARLDAGRERRYHRLLDRVENRRRAGRFLDIGCGAGRLLQVVAARGWKAWGADPAMARASVEYAGDIHIEPKTVQDCAFDAGSFDVVHANEVVEHVEDLDSLIAEIRRILRPGGLAIFRTPNYRSWTARLVGAKWREYSLHAKGHVGFLTPRTFGVLCAHHGLALSRITTRHFSVRDLWKSGRSPLRRVAHRACRLAEPLVRITRGGERLTVWAEKPI